MTMTMNGNDDESITNYGTLKDREKDFYKPFDEKVKATVELFHFHSRRLHKKK